jgi:hypothetical protein
MLEYEIYGESDFQGDDLLKKPVLEVSISLPYRLSHKPLIFLFHIT